MSKRTSWPASPNDVFKKPKLDIKTSRSSSSAVYSPPSESHKGEEQSWGDDVDDEILLIASQAFEKVETPETPIENEASSSKSESTSSRISYDSRSPGGIAKIGHIGDEHSLITYASSISNLAVNEHVQNLIKQLNACKKENDKLKTEHDTSIDKYLTKDGEVSILRMQLKNAQAQVAAVKREKVKYQEISQIEWTDKLKTANNEIHSCKSQLQFKNLEIANLKEKCKLLETSRIKFIEPTNPGLDHSRWAGFTQKSNFNNSKVEMKSSVSTTEMAIQVNSTSNIIKLIPPQETVYPLMKSIHESFFNHSPLEIPIIFSSNKKTKFVENSNFSQTKKKILENYNSKKKENKDSFLDNLRLDCIYQDVSKLRGVSIDEINSEKYFTSAIKVLLITKFVLIKALNKLEKLNSKLILLNIREMDEKYIEFSGKDLNLWFEKSVFDGKCWFENEQGIDARRIVGVLAPLCKYIKTMVNYICNSTELNDRLIILKDIEPSFKLSDYSGKDDSIMTLLSKICHIIGKIGCSNYYIGFLTSVCYLLDASQKHAGDSNHINTKIYTVLREIILLRPHVKIIKPITSLLKKLTLDKEILKSFCNDSSTGNLMFNYNEGVALYNNDTCIIQLLCNNIEVWTAQFSKIDHIEEIFSITDEFLQLRQNGKKMNALWAKYDTQIKCLCHIKIKRCLCLCLYKCAALYEEHSKHISESLRKKLNSTIRTGIMILSFCIINDIEFTSHLSDYEGYYQIFIMSCQKFADQLQLQDIHKDALTELSDSIVAISENTEDSLSKPLEAWQKCFDNFSLNE